MSNFLTSIYDKCMTKARKDSRKGAWFLGCFSVAESMVLPFPVDPVLVFVSLAHPKKALKFALLTTITSILGGALSYFIGYYLWSSVSPYLSSGILSQIEVVFEQFRQHDALAVFIGGFTFLPYKIFALGGGIAKISFFNFVVFSFLSRGLRFFILGGVIYCKGASIEPVLRKYLGMITIVISVLVITLYLALS